MQGKDLIDMLKGFEDFEIVGTSIEIDNSKSGYDAMEVLKFKIDGIDIGYSDKIISLGLTRK